MNDQKVGSNYAVVLQNVFYERKAKSLLNNVCLKIEQGEIFALLGPNGCGKTTLLKMILGCAQPNKGSVKVFGGMPRNKNFLVPGSTLGYMPQESGLFSELTVEENLRFYAKLFQMNSTQFEERLNQLTLLLNLCEGNRRIDSLSDRQQKLVSMAVAIVHRPNLIILEEPTIGVDPILNHQIWTFLECTCRQKGNTVIITTHYIEEAKRASNVGFMKSGSILRQSNPQKLMDEYQCPLIEVYFNVYHNSKVVKSSDLLAIESDTDLISDISFINCTKFSVIKHPKQFSSFWRIMALMWRFNICLKHNLAHFFILIAIPLYCLLLINLCFGQISQNMGIAVYSNENPPKLSKQLIDSIDANILNVIQFESKDSAIDSLLKGKNVFALTFSQNFSKHFESRIWYPFEANTEEEDDSIIRLYVNSYLTLTSTSGVQHLVQVFHRFVANVSTSLSLNPIAFGFPITIEQPIYGSHPITGQLSQKFIINYEYLVPSVLIITLFSTSMLFSALLFNLKHSYLTRYYVCGGQPLEILISYFITTMIYITIQVFVVLTVASHILDITQVGSYTEVYLLCFLESLMGVSTGILLSLSSGQNISISMTAAIVILPIYFTSNLFWPLEAIPPNYRLFIEWSPLSKPIDSLRSVMLRGLPYSHPNVVIGYFVSLSYTLLINFFIFISFKNNQEHFV